MSYRTPLRIPQHPDATERALVTCGVPRWKRNVDVRHLELEHRADAAETTPSTGGAK